MSEQHDIAVHDGSVDTEAAHHAAPDTEATTEATTEAGQDMDTDTVTDTVTDTFTDTDGGTDGDADGGADGGAESDEARRPRRRAKVADLEREGEVAADFLETLLDIADLDGDIDVDVDGDRAAVSIVDSEEGRVPRRLVGTNGTVLEALQELTRLAVQSATGERSRLMLDVAGHRAERRTALVSIAHEAIEAVKASGQERALEPMSAFERKVVHDEVLAAGLVSESDGVEPRRYVVVHPE